MRRKLANIVGPVALVLTLAWGLNQLVSPTIPEREGRPMGEKVTRTEDEWKAMLTPEQYRVTRRAGTERAFTGEYWDCHEPGTYECVCCGQPLFDADTKFESGTGWPSFFAPIDQEAVSTKVDRGFFMTRTEVLCSRCDAHLGHVFPDGPRPSGLRYCMNSAALKHRPQTSKPTGE